MLTFVLEGSGYKVVTARNAHEALERIEPSAFNLVLLAPSDAKTIDSKLAREIKQVSPGTPIILVSGQTLLAPEGLTYVDACIGKDATLDSLPAKIRGLIGGK